MHSAAYQVQRARLASLYLPLAGICACVGTNVGTGDAVSYSAISWEVVGAGVNCESKSRSIFMSKHHHAKTKGHSVFEERAPACFIPFVHRTGGRRAKAHLGARCCLRCRCWRRHRGACRWRSEARWVRVRLHNDAHHLATSSIRSRPCCRCILRHSAKVVWRAEGQPIHGALPVPRLPRRDKRRSHARYYLWKRHGLQVCTFDHRLPSDPPVPSGSIHVRGVVNEIRDCHLWTRGR